MRRQRYSTVAFLVFQCLFLVLASNNRYKGDNFEQTCDQLKSYVVSSPSLGENNTNVEKDGSLSIYKYKPPRNEWNYEWGFSGFIFACNEVSRIKLGFEEIQLKEKGHDYKSFDTQESYLLTLNTLNEDDLVEDLNIKTSDYMIEIISSRKENFDLFLLKEGNISKIILKKRGKDDQNDNSNAHAWNCIINVKLGDQIAILSGPGRGLEEAKNICNFLLCPKSSELGKFVFDNSLPIQALIVTIDKMPKISQISPEESLSNFFLLKRWFSHSKTFDSRSIDSQTLSASPLLSSLLLLSSESRPFYFGFPDLSTPIDSFKLMEFYSSAFSVILGSNKIRISDFGEPSTLIEFTLDGFFIIFEMTKGKVVPFNFFIYRKEKILAMSACDHVFKIKIQPNDQIIIIARDEEDYNITDVGKIVMDKSSGKLLEILHTKTPYIRVNIQERDLSPNMGRPRLYRVPVASDRDDGIQILEVMWISHDGRSDPNHSPIIFDCDGIVAGKLVDQTEAGYADERAMNFYHKMDLSSGKNDFQPGCIVGLWKLEDEEDKWWLSIDFIIAPKSSFTVIRHNNGKDGNTRKTWTTGINEGNNPRYNRVEFFSLVEGSWFEVYEGGDFKNLKVLWQPNSDKYDEVNRMEELSGSLSSQNKIMGFRFRVGEVKKIDSTIDITKFTANHIAIQRWFGVRMEEQIKPPIERSQAKSNNEDQPYAFSWGYSLGDKLWTIEYENYYLEIDDNHLLVTFKFDNELKMKTTLEEFILKIEIQGKIPFTLALYRKDRCIISWNEPGLVKFDDFEPNSDEVVLIPWKFFVKNVKDTLSFNILPTSLSEFLLRLKSGNLVAKIMAKPRDSK